MRGLFLFVVIGACAGTPAAERGVLVQAADVGGGEVRVSFRYPHPYPTEETRRARLRADGGRLLEVTHSPDLRTVSALWLDREGALTCRFPRGAEGRLDAGAAGDPAVAEYVFLAREDVRVTAGVPRACLMTPRLRLRILVEPGLLPARLELPDGKEVALVEPVSVHVLQLDSTSDGVLRAGEMMLRVHTAADTHAFLVGVDPDGAPTASSGYVQKW